MSKLSQKELAALDLLIAHIEENGDAADLSMIGGLVNAVTNAVNEITAVTNAISNPSVSNVLALANSGALFDVFGAGVGVQAGPVQAGFQVGVAGDERSSGTTVIPIDSKSTLSELVELKKSNS